MPAAEVNQQLATACQQCGSACCKKGRIFLPRDEYLRIRRHVQAIGPGATAEFDSRISDHGIFFLYDQDGGCQFLDAANLCGLHELGLKPTECFWWPYHVYTSDDAAELELRLFLDCCDAHKADRPDSPYHRQIEQDALRIGFDVIQKFRETYGGAVAQTRLIKPLSDVKTGVC